MGSVGIMALRGLWWVTFVAEEGKWGKREEEGDEGFPLAKQ